jgi:hypothetical protein
VPLDSDPVAAEYAVEPERREQRHFISLGRSCHLLAPADPAPGRMQLEPQRDRWAWDKACRSNPIAAKVRSRWDF